jgi:hypothetical protein
VQRVQGPEGLKGLLPFVLLYLIRNSEIFVVYVCLLSMHVYVNT